MSAGASVGGSAERRARALLTRIAEPDAELSRHVVSNGAVSAVKGLRDGTLKVKNTLHWQARVAAARPERDLDAARACGARFIVPGDDEWPSSLDELAYLDDEYASVPYGLWVRGDLDLRATFARSVAIVGARASSAYGEYVAAEFALGAADRGWTVVSGGAYGIDGAAHRGAISGGGVTVAVLACGVDVAYPRGHSALIERVASAGLVISEWPPGCAPMRHRFLVRNRVIAALTAGTVVVEAASRSGSLSTANRARDLGRHVMSVPGPITSAMSAGANALLKQPWASCVTSAADVIELVGAIGDDLAPQVQVRDDPRDDLDQLSRRVLDAVPVRTPVGPARIASAAGVELRQVTRCLGALAARGLVTRTDAGWRLPPRRARSVAEERGVADERGGA